MRTRLKVAMVFLLSLAASFSLGSATHGGGPQGSVAPSPTSKVLDLSSADLTSMSSGAGWSRYMEFSNADGGFTGTTRVCGRGESTTRGYEQWIHLGSLAFRAQPGASGDLALTKDIDKATPTINRCTLDPRGVVIPRLQIHVRSEQGGLPPFVGLAIVLKNAVISDQQVSAAGSFSEQLTINYEMISIAYRTQNSAGVVSAPIFSCFNNVTLASSSTGGDC